MIKQAVIIENGLLNPENCFEIDDVCIVEQSIKKLISAGIEEIIVGINKSSDYYKELAKKYHIISISETKCEDADTMGILSGCSSYIKGDFILIESNLIYDSVGLKVLQNEENSNVMLTAGKDNTFTGISKVTKEYLTKMVTFYNNNKAQTNYADVLKSVSDEKETISTHTITYYAWAKINSEEEFKSALNNVYPRIKENESINAIRREVLLNPGPSTTSDSVKYAQVVADICPRELEFGNLMEQIAEDLTAFVADPKDYITVMFGCSGTGADEAMVSSCIPPDGKLLVVDNGSYGNRLAKIASVYNIDMDVYKSSTYEPINIKELEEKMKSAKYTTFAIVYHETTTGLLNDLATICPMAKKYGMTTIVDAVSAYGGMPMNLEKLGIDFATCTSNKHIGGMAGIGFVVCNRKKLLEQKDWPMRNYYLNLYDQYKYFLETKQTRFTPPVQTLYALRQAITETKVETIEKRFERFTECWNILVKGLKEIGLKMLVKEEYQSHFITAILIPETDKYNFNDLHDYSKSFGFTIYPGKLGNIDTFRIANMGDIRPEEMMHFICILRDYMHSIGVC